MSSLWEIFTRITESVLFNCLQVPMKPKDQQTLMTNLPVEGGYTDISCASDKESTLSFTDFSDEIPTHLMMMSPGLKPIKQLHKRKGVPRRAPLY
ncbi:hypothetical protein Q3G72_029372 [Acer saccharum]|nr:hypothetical protein Q3G72_016724 [Acer saccharum]KAK1553129.1 hypothetical protein Q3G72_029372 [Acer saccharum]